VILLASALKLFGASNVVLLGAIATATAVAVAVLLRRRAVVARSLETRRPVDSLQPMG